MKENTTKNKILAAARTLFVTHGFAGTSVGNIAKLAEVNHSLVFHHYKNKEQLWIAVKQSIVLEANQQAKRLPSHHLSWKQCLRELFISNIAFYRDNPDIIRMLNWQRLERETSSNIGVTNSGDMKEWVELIKHYQQLGEISPTHKPEWIVTLILSIISSIALDPNAFLSDKQHYDDYINFCIKLLIEGL